MNKLKEVFNRSPLLSTIVFSSLLSTYIVVNYKKYFDENVFQFGREVYETYPNILFFIPPLIVFSLWKLFIKDQNKFSKSKFLLLSLVTALLTNIFSFAILRTLKDIDNNKGCYYADHDNYTNLARYYSGFPAAIEEPYILREDPSYSILNHKSQSVQLSRGNNIIIAFGKGSLHHFNTQTNKTTPLSNEHQLSSLSNYLNDNYILAGSYNGELILYDLNNRKVERIIKIHQGAIKTIAIDRENNYIATGSEDGKVVVLDANSFREIRSFYHHFAEITTLAFIPHKNTILSGSYDSYVFATKIDSGVKKEVFKGQEEVFQISHHKRGKQFFISTRTGPLWKCLDETFLCQQIKHYGHGFKYFTLFENPITSSAGFDIFMAASDHAGNLRVYDSTFTQKSTIIYSKYLTEVTSLNAVDKHLIIGTRDGHIRNFSLDEDKTVFDEKLINGTTMWKKPFGIPHNYRQAGYPLIIAGMMKITGLDSACSVRVVQPWIFIIFTLLVLTIMAKKISPLSTVLPLYLINHPDFRFLYFSKSDTTEFFLIVFTLALTYLVFKLLKGQRSFLSWILFTVILLLSLQIKLLVGVFVLIILIAAFIYNLPFIRGQIKGDKISLISLVLIGMISFVCINVTKKAYPETSRFNSEMLYAQKAFLPIPNDHHEELFIKYKQFKDISDKFESLGNKVYTNGANTFLPIFHEYDRLTIVDPDTKTALTYTTNEAIEVIKKLIAANYSSILLSGVKNLWRHLDIFFLWSKFPFGNIIWLLLLTIGAIYCLINKKQRELGIISIALFGFYCFFCFMHNLHDRYWLPTYPFYFLLASLGIFQIEVFIKDRLKILFDE